MYFISMADIGLRLDLCRHYSTLVNKPFSKSFLPLQYLIILPLDNLASFIAKSFDCIKYYILIIGGY